MLSQNLFQTLLLIQFNQCWKSICMYLYVYILYIFPCRCWWDLLSDINSWLVGKTIKNYYYMIFPDIVKIIFYHFNLEGSVRMELSLTFLPLGYLRRFFKQKNRKKKRGRALRTIFSTPFFSSTIQVYFSMLIQVKNIYEQILYYFLCWKLERVHFLEIKLIKVMRRGRI